MNHPATSPDEEPRSTPMRRRLGLPLVVIVGLALLAAPRVVFHDLDIIHEGTFANALFVFLPPIIWIVTALVARVPSPLTTLLAVGLCYGVFLALGHQILWNHSMGDNPPELGGNLAALDPGAQALVFRTFAVGSSLLTGVLVGALSGALAWGLKVLLWRPQN
ncbi:hypothetical protein [Brevibacterium sp. VCM10]|uniref:hypothetical protein n=1 Tax=Brevibacterium sp. VCM10 TaxID=1381751 RepID=UPI0004B9CDF3|nr:hypothetical protein [Brevibacterium sp. VCM10]